MSKRGRIVLLVIALVAVCELASFLGAWVLRGRLPSWSAWQAERDAVVGRSGDAGEEHTVADGARGEVVHPFVGYVGDPSVSSTANEMGFEGDVEPLQKRTPETWIVGVLGGSAAADFAANGGRELQRALAESDELRDRRPVLVNLARDGYKQPQQLMTLGFLLSLGGEFDVVINIDGVDEVASHATGNGAKGVYPVYPRDWYLTTSYAPDRRLRRLIGRASYLRAAMADLAAAHSGSLRYSMSWNLIWEVRQAGLTRRYEEARRGVAAYRTENREQVPYRTSGPRYSLSEHETYELLVDIWRRGSRQLDGLCRENGIRFLHFLEPATEALRRRDDAAAKAWAALAEQGPYLRSLGVDFTDLGAGGLPPGDLGTEGFRRIARRAAEATASPPR